MPKLSSLVNTKLNRETIMIQGESIPVSFTMKTFPILEKAYGKPYAIFEAEMNQMLTKNNGKVSLGNNEVKLMYALIYSMMRTAGIDCTMAEVEGAIGIHDLQGIFQVVLNIFTNQNFQEKDMGRMKTEKK